MPGSTPGCIGLIQSLHKHLDVLHLRPPFPQIKYVDPHACPPQCCAAWPNPNITDRGIAGMEAGWFDLSCLSGPSDFCRYQDFGKLSLGGRGIQWTCALAGDNRQYTEIGYITRNASSITPCSQSEA